VTPFATIIADPPWKFRDGLPGPKRGAASHYPVLSVSDIQRLPLPPLAADAYLLLWRVASMQSEALSVVSAWGFTVKTELVWIKTTKRGKRHFGMGHHLRGEHEVCLVATRGRVKPLCRKSRSVFTAPVGKHSEKPDAFYDLVRETFGGPIVELFARREREGIVTMGNEIDGLDLRRPREEMIDV